VSAKLCLASGQQSGSKRLINTPVRGAGSVLKCPDDRKNRVVSAYATHTSGSSAVGVRVCEQWYAAERVLPESRFELQHAGSPSEKTGWKRRRKPISSASRLVPVELAAKKSPTQQEPSCWLSVVLPGSVRRDMPPVLGARIFLRIANHRSLRFRRCQSAPGAFWGRRRQEVGGLHWTES
jgi:hypothetical protein